MHVNISIILFKISYNTYYTFQNKLGWRKTLFLSICLYMYIYLLYFSKNIYIYTSNSVYKNDMCPFFLITCEMYVNIPIILFKINYYTYYTFQNNPGWRKILSLSICLYMYIYLLYFSIYIYIRHTYPAAHI
jgi:hypothetical protein